MRVNDDRPAASAFCVTCGGNITFQGDGPPHWCHDARPDRDAAHTASPRGPGRLLRCPVTPVPKFDGSTGRPAGTMAGCGTTWIADPDDEGDGGYTCPSCGMWFWPDDPENSGEQPPADAQPQEVQ